MLIGYARLRPTNRLHRTGLRSKGGWLRANLPREGHRRVVGIVPSCNDSEFLSVQFLTFGVATPSSAYRPGRSCSKIPFIRAVRFHGRSIVSGWPTNRTYPSLAVRRVTEGLPTTRPEPQADSIDRPRNCSGSGANRITLRCSEDGCLLEGLWGQDEVILLAKPGWDRPKLHGERGLLRPPEPKRRQRSR
jgi:hypothetical protein